VCGEGCINEHKQAVPNSVVFQNYVIDQLVKIFIVSCRISWMIIVIERICNDQIQFVLLLISVIYFIHFNIILSIFTPNPAALYALSNISATYFFRTITHITNCFQLTPISSNFLPNTPQVQFCTLNTFR